MEQQISALRKPDGHSLTAKIERLFITSYLLLGSSSQAEIATLKAIEFWNPESGEQALFQGALETASQSLNADPDSEQTESFSVEPWFPVELLPVWRLPRALRICYVLRVLVGLPSRLCHQIPGVEPSRVDNLAVYRDGGLRRHPQITPKEERTNTTHAPTER